MQRRLVSAALTAALFTACGNDPPSAPTVSIEPASPVTTDDLSLVLGDAVDPDGDEVTYTISWTVDGQPFDADPQTIPSSATAKGQVWAVSIVAADEKNTLEPVVATVTIANALPTVDGVTLSPTDPSTLAAIECAAGPTADADGDVVTTTFAWTINGTASGTGASLAPASTTKGDLLECSATPNDGEMDGLAASAQVTVVNSPPGAPEIRVDPEVAKAGLDALYCEVVADGLDVDEDPLTYAITWTADGLAYPGGFAGAAGPTTTTWAGDTVPAADTSLAVEWTCAVTANDGEADSPEVTASAEVLKGCDTLVVAHLPGWGSGYTDSNLAWTSMMAAQGAYGGCDVSMVEVSAGFSVDDLIATGAEVLLLGNMGGGTKTYTEADRAAVESFVKDGHGGVVMTYAVVYDTFGWAGASDLAGVDSSVVTSTTDATSTAFSVLEPTHAVMSGITSESVEVGGFPYAQLFTSPLKDNLADGASIVAESTGGAIVAADIDDQRGVWITTMIEYSSTTDDGQRIMYNSLVWAAGYAP